MPLDLVEGNGDEIRLGCTLAEFEQLDPAEETQFLPGTRGYEAYGPEQVLAWPYASLAGEPSVLGETVSGISETVTFDTIPLGEVEVRRGEQVHATDGAIGHVEGLVIDPRNHHVTHVLLQRGPPVGPQGSRHPDQRGDQCGGRHPAQHRQADVEDLPPVDIDHPAG